MIHILVGDEAAKNLEAAFELDENLRGEILVLRDTLGIGPVSTTEENGHDTTRTEFWKTVIPSFQKEVEDDKNIVEIVDKAISEEEPVCFWLSPCVSDVCAYYWLLPYFKNYPDVLHTINIIGLPFLNEKGQLFYPKNFSEVIPKEFGKTKRLLKKVTPAEYEVEGEEWARLQTENEWVRVYEGGKKITSKDLTWFDGQIKASLSDDFQKGSKVIIEAMKKITQTLSNLFLEWRLRELVLQGVIMINGDVEKGPREFEVKRVNKDVKTDSGITSE